MATYELFPPAFFQDSGDPPLVRAMRKGATELSAALDADSSTIDALLDNNEIGKCTLLVRAAREGNCQAVKVLVRHGADLRCTSSIEVDNVVGWLCWHEDNDVADALDAVLSEWVSRYGENEVKTMLNTPRHLGRTPLMNAVFAPNVKSAELLIQKYGADAAYAGEDGSCALSLAAQVGGKKGQRLVQLLLDAGADPNIGVIAPLMLAAQENDEVSVKALLAAGARPDGFHQGRHDSTNTPIEVAARFGFLGVLKILVAAEGAPQGRALESALVWARKQQHTDVEKFLIKAGAAPGVRCYACPRPCYAMPGPELVQGGRISGVHVLSSLPCGIVAGQATQAEAEAAKFEGPRVQETGGCFKVGFSGGPCSVTAVTPVVICEAHPSYYFEVAVEEIGGTRLVLAVGFARTGGIKRYTLPGWVKDTYGLHSDDGLLHANSAAVAKMMKGMSVRAGSTVGLGIEWSDGGPTVSGFRLFVTLDGTRQPTTVPLSEDKGEVFELFPVVGSDRAGTQVDINFGSKPFRYQDEGVKTALEKRRREGEAAKP